MATPHPRDLLARIRVLNLDEINDELTRYAGYWLAEYQGDYSADEIRDAYNQRLDELARQEQRR